MADQQAEVAPVAMETITLRGEDGTTHIYTMDNTQIISGLPNVSEPSGQEVMVENDGNVLYFVQSEAEDIQGVSYVVIDEQGNPSETVNAADLTPTDQEQVHYTELTSLELVPAETESAVSHTQLLDKTDKQQYDVGMKLEGVSGSEQTKVDEGVAMHSEMTDGEEESVTYVLCCHCCGEALDTMQELKDHLLEYHDISDDVDEEREESLVDEENVHFTKCPHCGDVFLNSTDYDSHVAKEHSARKEDPKQPEPQSSCSHKCQFCDMCFEIRSDLENHVDTEHDGFDDLFDHEKLYHKCPYCPRLYLAKWSNKSLTRHVTVDHPGEDMNAPIQVIKVKDRSHLRKLKCEIGTDIAKSQFPCKFCFKVFHWHKSLSRHIKLFHKADLDLLSAEDRRDILGKERIKNKSKTGDDTEVLSCPYCTKAFTWRKSLKRHVFDFHSEKMGEFEEDNGDRRSSKHRSKYWNVDKENVFFKCMFCSLVSKYIHSIKNHMKKKHVQEMKDLDITEITLPTVDAKSGAYKVKENDSRPREERLSEYSVVFNCPKCSYATNNASNLQRHLTSRLHSEDKNNLKMASFKQRRPGIQSPVTKSKVQVQKSSGDKATDIPETSLNDMSTSFDSDTAGCTTEEIQIQQMSDIPELCKEFVNLKVTFKCPDCSTDAFYFETLQDHYKTCHPDKPFNVTQESSVFAEHIIKEIKSLKALECPYCDLILSQVHVLEQHASLNHLKCLDQLQIKQEPTEADNEAGDVYKQDGTLQESALSKSVVTAYRCCVCICSFSEILDLVKHMGIVHPEAKKSAKGPKKVGRKRKHHEVTSEKADSAPAVNSETTGVEYANKCPHCSFGCKRASALNFHIAFNHAKIKQEPVDEETPRKKTKLDKVSDNTPEVVTVEGDEPASPEVPILQTTNKQPEKTPRKRGRPKKLKDKNETAEMTNQAKIVEKVPRPDNTRGVEEKGMSDIPASITKEAVVLLEDLSSAIGKGDESTIASTVVGNIDKTGNEKVTPQKACKRSFVKASKKDKTESVEEQLTDKDIFDDIDLGGDNDRDTDYEPKFEEKQVALPTTPCMRHKCPYCDSGNFLSLRFLEKHVKRVHPDDFQTFSLSDVKAAEPVSDTLHRCCYCKKSFPSQSAVHEHMSNTHKAQRSVVNKNKPGNYSSNTNNITMIEPGIEIKTEPDDEDSEGIEYEENRYRQSALKTGRAPKRLKTEAGSVCYKCKYCNVFFSSQSSVIRHAQLVHQHEQKIHPSDIEQLVNATETDIENQYKCPYCDKSSVWKKCIVKHVRLIHPEVTDFTADDILIEIGMCKDVIKSPEISRFQCPFCDSITKWRKSMMRHIRSLHPEKCRGVDLQTLNLEIEASNTGQALDRIKTPRRVHCPECDFTCRVIQKMREHFSAYHPEKEDSNTDGLFQYTYINDDIKVEMDGQDDDSRYTHHCHICKTSYVWKKSLVYHMRKSHPADVADAFDALQNIVDIVDKCSEDPVDIEKYKCHVCLEQYKYKTVLKKHMVRCHPKEADRTSSIGKQAGFQCTVCGLTFKSLLAKRIHTCRKHSYLTRKGLLMSCGVCLKSFASHLALTKHKACHHLVNKRTNCHHCGKLFSSKTLLFHHEKTCQKTLLQSKRASSSSRRSLLKTNKTNKKDVQQKRAGSVLNEEQPSGMPHKCQLCGQGFSQAQYLREHLLNEYSKKNWHLQGIFRKVKTYACNSCDKSFSLPSVRDQHIADIHKDQTHMCEICGKIFASTTALKRHNVKHGEKGGLDERGACELCGLTMIKRNLAKHYMYKHPDSLVCECDICQSQVDGEGMVVCNVCGMKFCRKMLLQAHKKAEHQSSGKNYKCKYCSKLFFTNRMRYLHLHNHHGQELGRLLAEANAKHASSTARGETVEGEEGQSTHVIHIGDGQGMQYLPKLSEASLSAVIKEMMIVSSDKACKLPYKCLLCGRCFAKTKYIRLHIRRSHVKDEDQPYRCKICGSGFVRLTEFRKHSRSHSGFRPYKCKICAKAFKQQANLMDHMNIHSATKTFECFICKRLFRQRGALNAHVLHHDKLKPFKCMFCDKGFTTRGELSRHMQSYDLGEAKPKDSKSFMCHICQESFNHFPILLKHIEERHPERPYSCLVCGEKYAAFISLYNHKLKNGHFLATDMEPAVGNEAVSHVRKIRRSTKDIQNAVYAIEQREAKLDELGIVKDDSVVVIEPLEVMEDQMTDAAVEVVIEQFPPDEDRDTPNENEELLSIAKQLTELSTYTENEQGDVENATLLQEEDEIMKDMLDADQDLLANIGKQLVVTRGEEVTSTAEEYTTVSYTNTDSVKVSQDADMVVSIDGTQQSQYVIAEEKNEVVSETPTNKTTVNNMEELAELIAQNPQLGLGESVTAFQTEDGSIIYFCTDTTEHGEEAVYEVPTTSEYQETSPRSISVNDTSTHAEVKEEMIIQEHDLTDQTEETDRGDGEADENVEIVGNTEEREDIIVRVQTETNIGQSAINGFTQQDVAVSAHQDYNEETQKVVEYMHGEQTFIEEELIDTNYNKTRFIETGDIANFHSKGARYVYDQNVYKCMKCDYQCSTKKFMKKHWPRHTPFGNRQHGCQECEKRFVTRTELERHMTTHTGERRYQCKYCDKRFKQPGHLHEHTMIHLGQKKNICSDCPAKFITKQQLKVHWQRAHSNVRPTCNECGKDFSDKASLIKHKGAIHSLVLGQRKQTEDTGAFQCHICGSSFSRNARLQDHLLEHKPEEERRKFVCELCGVSFKANHLLSDHKRLKHSDQEPEICEYCGTSFKLKKQLKLHIRMKHTKGNERGKKQFECGCGKKFSNRNSLSYHIGTNEVCSRGMVIKHNTDY